MIAPYRELRGRKTAAGLLLTLFLLIILAGCAAKQELPQEKVAPVTAPAKASVEPAPPAPEAVTPPVEKKKAPEAPATVARPKDSPYRQMLQSAGRNPDAPQPEAGFLLNLPERAGDGQAFFVEFAAEGVSKVSFSWRDRTLTLTPEGRKGSSYQALLPVKLDEAASSLPLVMTVAWQDGKSETFKADMPIRRGKYPVQKLKVDQKFVTPPASVQEKIKKDRAEMRAALGTRTERQYWSLPMLRPVPGHVTSLFGMRREFNGVPKAPHKGVDFSAKEGDPIKAADDGIVVLVSEHYYGGNTVVIDHGLSVFSVYLHLSGFNTATGQKVSRGDVIGFIGSTGRVTGPHLHLSFHVLGESVDASKCLDM